MIVRTQPGSLIDRALHVGFQVDGIDSVHKLGWSVLVRGLLDHIDDVDLALLAEEIDPEALGWVSTPKLVAGDPSRGHHWSATSTPGRRVGVQPRRLFVTLGSEISERRCEPPGRSPCAAERVGQSLKPPIVSAVRSISGLLLSRRAPDSHHG